MKPNYKQSTLSLISSITKACGGKPLHTELKSLPSKELSQYKNVILVVIDGMGVDMVNEHSKGFFKKYLYDTIHTTFPPTTAAGITTLQNGYSPAEHGITGWHMHVKELGGHITSIPFTTRFNTPIPFKFDDWKKTIPLPNRIKRKTYVINESHLAYSEFSEAQAGKAEILKYSTLRSLQTQISKAQNKRGKKYIFVYTSIVDSVCHNLGKNNPEAIAQFHAVEKAFSRISLKNSIILITADHGQVESPHSKQIELWKHPKMTECLSQAVVGEPRTAFCYVHPHMERQFVQYVRTKLKKYCILKKSIDLLNEGWFGPGNHHPMLKHRIGDYVLLAKENYVLLDRLYGGEATFALMGNHGGISKEEIEVPLIVVK